MTKEEFKAHVSMAYDVKEHWEQFLERVWQLHLQGMPHWISVEDELPRCYIPYNNWDGTPSDVLESEKVTALLSDGTICIATFNQNLDVDTDNPIGSPYWFDEGHPEDGDRIRGEVTHWMALPQPPEHIAGISNKTACPDCFVAQYPPCGKGIPCCKCHEEGCNSRQPCPKKGGEQ